METPTTKPVSQILASKEFAEVLSPPAQPTPRSVNRRWADKWLRLKTGHHPKLALLESEVGAFVQDLWDKPERGRTLVLYGENGTGKTHCAGAIDRWIRRIGYQKQFVVRTNVTESLDSAYWHWPTLLGRFKSGEWNLTEGMIEAHVLILDELGGGHDPSRVGVDALCRVLSMRENRWNVITTNIDPAEWEQAFDRRIMSRLFRNSTLVDLSDVPDFNLM